MHFIVHEFFLKKSFLTLILLVDGYCQILDSSSDMETFVGLSHLVPWVQLELGFSPTYWFSGITWGPFYVT